MSDVEVSEVDETFVTPELKHVPIVNEESIQSNLNASDKRVKVDLQKHSEYTYVRKLGGGAQVDVFLVKKGKDYFAAKAYTYKIEKGNIDVGKRDEDFLDLHCVCRFKHPFIISKRDFVVGSNHFFVIMDYAQCNLEQYMNHINENGVHIEGQENDMYLSFSSKCTIIHQIGSALSFLSKIGYVHNDIKPVNVLIVDGKPVLTDFGLTRLVEEQDYTTQTYFYRSPEHLLIGKGVVDRMYKEMYTTKLVNKWKLNFSAGELWSFGIFCVNVIYGLPDMTHGYVDRKAPKVMNKLYCKDWYVTLMRLIMEYEQNSKSSYDAIIAAYGDPPSIEEDEDVYTAKDLLEHVCNCFLVMNQENRVSIDEFFTSPIFNEMGGSVSYPFRPKIHNPMVESPKEYTVNDINRIIHLLTVQSQNTCPQTFCTLEVIDLFVQRLPVYATTTADLYLFGATCLKMVDMIHNLGYYTLTDCAKICNIWCSSKFKAKDVNNLLLKMLTIEEGTPVIPSTYNMAPCSEVVVHVAEAMQDYSTYMTLGQRGMIKQSLEVIRKRTAKRETCGSIRIVPFP